MEFTQRKLPRSEAASLRRSSLDSIKPYALLLAPMYVFLRKNSKFLAVKGPLDFFSPQELEKLKQYETFYVPQFISTVLPFRDAAKSARLTLSWRPQIRAGEEGSYPEVPLPPAPYEISDAILRILGPLWGAGGEIEPFFVTVFAHEVCDPMPPEQMKAARDLDVFKFEDCLFLAGWSVFLALHLGICDVGTISKLRLQIFAQEFPQCFSMAELGPMSAEGRDIVDFARASLPATTGRIRVPELLNQPGRLSQKLNARFERIFKDFIRKDRPAATIFGQKGLITDAAAG